VATVGYFVKSYADPRTNYLPDYLMARFFHDVTPRHHKAVLAKGGDVMNNISGISDPISGPGEWNKIPSG
jgi:hypothetical protein